MSKTLQGPEKTSGITRLERGTQFPILHSSVQRTPKRGPLCPRYGRIREFSADSASQQLLAHECRAPVFAPGNVVLRETAVVEEVLLRELIHHALRRGPELFLELFAQCSDRVIATLQQLECVRIDLVHVCYHTSRVPIYLRNLRNLRLIRLRVPPGEQELQWRQGADD